MASDSDYRTDPRPSITQLAKLDAMPPMHARVEWARPSTPAMRLGTALHSAILSPGEFGDRYVAGIDCDRRTKEGKAAWAAFLADAGDREVLDPEDHESILAMRESIRSLDEHAYLRLLDAVERPLFGTVGGVEVRGRPDAFATRGPGMGLLLELKTTSGMASRAEFERAIATFGYGFQAAGYSLLLEQNGVTPRHLMFIVVETKPPHDAAAYVLEPEVIAWYRPRVEAAARLYAGCVESGEWPGHARGLQWIGFPAWHEARRSA